MARSRRVPGTPPRTPRDRPVRSQRMGEPGGGQVMTPSRTATKRQPNGATSMAPSPHCSSPTSCLRAPLHRSHRHGGEGMARAPATRHPHPPTTARHLFSSPPSSLSVSFATQTSREWGMLAEARPDRLATGGGLSLQPSLATSGCPPLEAGRPKRAVLPSSRSQKELHLARPRHPHPRGGEWARRRPRVVDRGEAPDRCLGSVRRFLKGLTPVILDFPWGEGRESPRRTGYTD